MDYRVLALDLDGTLTNSQKIITPKTKEALMLAQKNGTTVVLASGRPTCGITALAEELELAHYGGYILSFNGGCMISCADGKPFSQQTLPSDLIPALAAFAEREKVNIISYEDNDIITENPDCPYAAIEARINGMNIRRVDSFGEYVKFPIPKCLMLADGAVLEQVEQRALEAFSSRLSVYRSEPYFLEIMPQNIDKAQSLGKLLKHLGLRRGQLICCGDGFNDASMIEYAGLGVAMGNAQPAVKLLANVVTGTNDEDGLVPVIEQYLLNR